MTSSFRSKTKKFSSNIQSDFKAQQPMKTTTNASAKSSDDLQTYREESKKSEYGKNTSSSQKYKLLNFIFYKKKNNNNDQTTTGTKHIDPDTGLIYFKYDFGYEFGIVLPGESNKRTVASSSNTIQGSSKRRGSVIDVPIIHEFSGEKNGYAAANKSATLGHPARGKFNNASGAGGKSVKWEPTSESEFSEAEVAMDSNNYHHHHKMTMMRNKNCHRGYESGDSSYTQNSNNLQLPCTSPARWDYTTPSPRSLSPSLPDLSPRNVVVGGPYGDYAGRANIPAYNIVVLFLFFLFIRDPFIPIC